MSHQRNRTPTRPQNVFPLSSAALIREFSCVQVVPGEETFSGVSTASSRVEVGDLFVGLPGSRHHGARYSREAVTAGARGILTDSQGLEWAAELDVPVFLVDDPRRVVGLVAAHIYRASDSRMTAFGVTGTNGKTSVVYMIDAVLRGLGRRTGLSSTAERVIESEPQTSSLTTPEADEMQGLLGLMGERGISDVTLEVSAHAMSRERVRGIHFDVAVFTNFSQDHLDDYASMEDYFAAKLALFTPEWSERGVVCVDDAWSRRVVDHATIPLVTVGSVATGDPLQADWIVEPTSVEPRLTRFSLTGPEGQSVESAVDMVGDFSAVNAALALVAVAESGVEWTDLVAAFGGGQVIHAQVPGRMEVVSGDSGGPVVFVDYGHTPEAFARTLAALRAITSGRVIMVFGADGDRDATKRQAMGRVAATGADVVVITDYHPRTEDPAAIRGALMTGALTAESEADLHDVADQRTAIRFALSLAKDGDTVLYAGPGHETYQEIAGAKVPYDARAEMRQALREAGWPPNGAVRD